MDLLSFHPIGFNFKITEDTYSPNGRFLVQVQGYLSLQRRVEDTMNYTMMMMIFVINVFRRQGCPHLGRGHGPIVSSRLNYTIPAILFITVCHHACAEVSSKPNKKDGD